MPKTVQYNPPLSKEEDSLTADMTNTVASAMDCTGLAPSPPTSDQGVDSYQSIHHVPIKKEKFEYDYDRTSE